MVLKKEFENLAWQYVKEFCKKHEFDFEDNSDIYWVGNEVGDILVVNDYFISYKDIRKDIDDDIPKNVFWDWYDYSLSVCEATNGEKSCSYDDFLKGKRPYTNEELSKLKELHKKVEEAQQLLQDAIEKSLKEKEMEDSTDFVQGHPLSEIEFLIEEQKIKGGGSFVYSGFLYKVKKDGTIEKTKL